MNIRLENLKDQKIAIITIGLPGSGKSTWIKSFKSSTDREFAVISSDDILDRIAAEKGLTYTLVHKDFIGMATGEMKGNFRKAIEDGKSFIWDQTNMSKKKRRGILAQIPKDYYKIAVDFDVLPKELERRLDQRAKDTGKFIPKSVIEDFGKRYERPTKDEGFDEIVYIHT